MCTDRPQLVKGTYKPKRSSDSAPLASTSPTSFIANLPFLSASLEISFFAFFSARRCSALLIALPLSGVASASSILDRNSFGAILTLPAVSSVTSTPALRRRAGMAPVRAAFVPAAAPRPIAVKPPPINDSGSVNMPTPNCAHPLFGSIFVPSTLLVR